MLEQYTVENGCFSVSYQIALFAGTDKSLAAYGRTTAPFIHMHETQRCLPDKASEFAKYSTELFSGYSLLVRPTTANTQLSSKEGNRKTALDVTV